VGCQKLIFFLTLTTLKCQLKVKIKYHSLLISKTVSFINSNTILSH